MQLLFDCNGRMSGEVHKSCAALMSQEFYDGRLEVEGDVRSEFRFAKALPYPISITHLTSRAVIRYERSWSHIQRNRVGLRVIWFVRKGSFHIDRAHGPCVIRAGQGGILDSSVPFNVQLMLDESGQAETFQVIVPNDIFMEHLAAADQFYETFSLNSSEGRIADGMLNLLVAEGDHIRRELAEPLTGALLDAVADCIGCHKREAPHRKGLGEQRLADIENYILLNLADPDLCYHKVAERCKISPRYLGYLLKANDTTFSDLLWKNRLPKARDALVARASREQSIKTIAFMSGFKSAAHFSRMFKAAYGCSPREYRLENAPTRRSRSADVRTTFASDLVAVGA
ncbi:MAG TPA: AraC family transcriptional regulator [Vicinamibacterales bacterium]|nr:AraC family transcriptional regulator [Vicinamibacterales bacterium]